MDKEGSRLETHLEAASRALDEARQGWRSSKNPKSIVVVGAGLAGLCAAFELRRLGHKVTIVEASERVGGRVLTLREPFLDGQYAEAGAFFVPGAHTLLMGYIHFFKLALADVPPPMTLTLNLRGETCSTPFRGLRSLYYLQGRRVLPSDGLAANWPVPLTPEEQRLGLAGMIEKYIPEEVLERLGNPRNPAWPPPRLNPYDDMSFAEFLRSQGASQAAIKVLSAGFYNLVGNGTASYSSLWQLRDIVAQTSCASLPAKSPRPRSTSYWRAVLGQDSVLETELADRDFSVEGGTDRLPLAFAKALEALKCEIVLKCPVNRIEQGPQGVDVHTSGKGNRRFQADALICAIPLPPMRRIRFDPPLSQPKQEAVEALPNTSVTRVFLQTRSRFWYQEGLSATVSTDLPPNWMFEQTLNQPGPKGILDNYMAGPQARSLQPLSQEERIEFVLEQASLIFPRLKEEFETGTAVVWDENPWQRGDYIWFKPGQFRMMPRLLTPEGRIHFAGDQTSALPGWMEGALESGLRAVEEIHGLPGV